MEKNLFTVLLENFKMKNKIYTSLVIMIFLGLALSFVYGDTVDDSGFNSESFTTELGNLEGVNMDFYGSDEFNAKGNVDYEINSETGMITFSSSSDTGSVFVKGQEFDVSE